MKNNTIIFRPCQSSVKCSLLLHVKVITERRSIGRFKHLTDYCSTELLGADKFIDSLGTGGSLRLEGGIKCSGKKAGNSAPSSLILAKYIARANSSRSNRPSSSTSANFHTLDRTELGNFVLRNSSLAAEKRKEILQNVELLLFQLKLIYQCE